MHEVDWSRPESFRRDDRTSNRPFSQNFRKVFVPTWFALISPAPLQEFHPVLGTVLSDIAKSRADIEGARLLVLCAALQIDKYQAKGALKEVGIAKVRKFSWKAVQSDSMRVQ